MYLKELRFHCKLKLYSFNLQFNQSSWHIGCSNVTFCRPHECDFTCPKAVHQTPIVSATQTPGNVIYVLELNRFRNHSHQIQLLCYSFQFRLTLAVPLYVQQNQCELVHIPPDRWCYSTEFLSSDTCRQPIHNPRRSCGMTSVYGTVRTN